MRFLLFLWFPLTASADNWVVIVADDLGYGETGMMGAVDDIATPHIDALARGGVRCTSGYVTSSYCSPSRAGLMTGVYQSRFGYDHNPVGPKNSHPNAGLPADRSTFVESMRRSGHATAMIGKWHLGTRPPQRPTAKGFDRFFGFLHEGHFYVPGPPYEGVWTMLRDTSLPAGETIRDGRTFRGHYARIDEPAYDRDNPILDHAAPVTPTDYLTDVITGRAVDFIDEHADGDITLVVSYNAVHSPMQALDRDHAAAGTIDGPQRRIFAGMLIALDRGVGQLMATLKRHALTERTTVVFLSDNGGPTEELTSSNAPLRGGKGSLYEGGIRVPMVWHRPGVYPAGATESRPVVSLDIAATATVDTAYATDGVDVRPWLGRPEVPAPRRDLYWRMPHGGAAIRVGDDKAVRPPRGGEWELFDLEADIAEATDLATQRPGRLGELVDRWRKIDDGMQPTRPLD